MNETLLIALVFAKVKGYKLRPLLKLWQIYPILIFNIIYIFLEIQAFLGNYKYVKYARTLETVYLCLFITLIIKFKLNISAIIGALAIFVGTALNKIAIISNNGHMPVFPSISYITGYIKTNSFIKANDIHILGNDTTKLKFLTDIFDIGYSILSIGDIFIRAFPFIVIYYTIKCVNTVNFKNS